MKPSDKVSVNMTLEEFKNAQKKAKVPGGWNDGMKQVNCKDVENGSVYA